MNTKIQCLVQACEELEIQYKFIDEDQNFIQINIDGKYKYFMHGATPLNDQVSHLIMLDKGFTYQLLKEKVKMPKTVQYVNPNTEEKYQGYVKFKNASEIKKDVLEHLDFPLVVKPYRGSQRVDVYKCKNEKSLEKALDKLIQNPSDINKVLLAQKFIEIQNEYRCVVLNKKIELIYEKIAEWQQISENLQKREFRKMKKVDSSEVVEKLENFVQPITELMDLEISGLDIVFDSKGRLYLIELNGSPGFEKYIEDLGEKEIVEFYKKLLNYLQTK